MTIDGIPILPHTAMVFAAINGEWGVRCDTNRLTEVYIADVRRLDPVPMILGTTPKREDAERIAGEIRRGRRGDWFFGDRDVTGEEILSITGLRWPTCFTEMGRGALQPAGG